MAVYQLENEHIYLEVASHGAELVRLVGKKTKKEYLFDGDPKYWKRHSPILFPFVGGVKNKEYRYNGKTYTMTQHGFARDMEFTLDSQTQDTLWFSIVSNETTMENYPFAFRLEVGYQLKGTEVTVLWNVINTDTKEMYFSIGAHPAFFASMTLEDGPDTDHIHVGDNIEGTFTCYRVTENAMALVDDTIPGFLLRKGFILGGLFDRIIRIRFSECGEYLVAACLPSGESAQSTLRPAR